MVTQSSEKSIPADALRSYGTEGIITQAELQSVFDYETARDREAIELYRRYVNGAHIEPGPVAFDDKYYPTLQDKKERLAEAEEEFHNSRCVGVDVYGIGIHLVDADDHAGVAPEPSPVYYVACRSQQEAEMLRQYQPVCRADHGNFTTAIEDFITGLVLEYSIRPLTIEKIESDLEELKDNFDDAVAMAGRLLHNYPNLVIRAANQQAGAQ